MTVIDEKVLKDSIEKGIEKIATEVVPTIVDEKVEDIKKDVTELKTEIKEFVKSLKISEKKENKEFVENTAKLFKAFAKGDMAEVKTLSEGVDADGGYLVPEEFEKTLFQVMEKYGVARRYCRKYTMGTDTRNITAVENTVVGYIVGEGSAITDSQPTFSNIKLEAIKIAALIPATNELIDDSMTSQEVFDLVLALAVQKFTEIEDAQVLAGSGSGLNFAGVLNIGTVKSLASGKTSINDITADDVISMVYSLPDKYVRNKTPRFYVNKSVLGILRGLTDKNGVKLLVDDYTGGNPRMLGYEVITTDVLPGVADDGADKKFFFFGDLDFYALGIRKGVTSEVGYRNGDFEKDIKSLKVIERVAGKALTDQAFVVLKTAAA